MTTLLTHFTDAPVAAAFGTVGLAGQLIWPWLRRRRLILSAQLGIAASYATQYGLMGQWSGTSVCSIGASQTFIALLAGNRPWLRWMGLGFLPLVWTLSYLTWCGPASLFALIACSLIMIGRMQGDTLRMRIFMLCASPFGISYDLTVGAAPALAGAILSAAMGLAALIRELRDRGWFAPQVATA